MRRSPLWIWMGWLIVWFVVPALAFPWGEEGHILITHKAIQMLPPEVAPLFEDSAEELARLSNVPDKKWKADPQYADRNNWHFLDIDLFDYGYPFADFPREREAAAKLYEKTGKNAGYLPWTIRDFYERLVVAFKRRDTQAIIENAGLLSHFAGDATMPLHSTRNYNGKFSGNLYYRVPWNSPKYVDKGVHQRFELGLLKFRLEAYTREVETSSKDRAQLEDVLETAFSVLVDAYWYIDVILAFDKMVGRELQIGSEMDSFQAKREAFYEQLDRRLGWLEVRQLQRGAIFLGNLWYSAWCEAGKPLFARR